jgi:hypothetical protein
VRNLRSASCLGHHPGRTDAAADRGQPAQAQILIPIATSLAFGLTSATLVVIFLVPAIYCVLDGVNAFGKIEIRQEANNCQVK